MTQANIVRLAAILMNTSIYLGVRAGWFYEEYSDQQIAITKAFVLGAFVMFIIQYFYIFKPRTNSKKQYWKEPIVFIFTGILIVICELFLF